jgi:cell division protein FtsI (penicillin-binding protein 3)
LVLVGGGLALLFAVVGGRAGQLTVLHGQHLAWLARQQQQRQVSLVPRRGPIVDRSGEPLALTVDAESLFADPRLLGDEPANIARVAAALGLRAGDLQRKVASASNGSFVWLKRLATPKEVAAVRAVGVSGVGTIAERRRVYPRAQLAAHVLGFAGVDAQGLEGVERQYDALIRPPGREIQEMERDARGRAILVGGIVVEEDPVGARVETTIDATLQAVAERELTRGVQSAGAAGGTAVVLDPWTGAVLALANAPSFDPNNVTVSAAATRRNRAVTDIYEPGSTLKAMLAAAALDQGVVAPHDRVFCENGRYRVGRHVINDHHKEQWLTFAEVLWHSSNIGAAKIGAALGAERLDAYLRAFGFASKTGIALPGEAAGRLRPARRWKPIDVATASFGQGLAVTPLQLASAFAVIANGGELLRPYVVSQIVAPDGRVLLQQVPETVRRVIRSDTARVVRGLLRGPVEHDGGTGRLARIPGVAVAGKTGTSQKVDPTTGRYSAKARVASFAGFVPADAPRFVIVVVIDEPTKSQYGGVVAAPVFREIAAATLGRTGIDGKATRQVQEVRGGRGVEDVGAFLDSVPRAGGRPARGAA